MSQSRRTSRLQKRRLKRKKLVLRIVGRVALCLATALIVLAGGLYALLALVCYGPSQTAGDKFVTSAMETSALKFLPGLFFSPAQIAEIQSRNSLVAFEDETDTSLIVFAPSPTQGSAPGPDSTPAAGGEEPGAPVEPAATEEPDIQVVDVKGATYYGYMMIVKDPSRVFVGMCAGSYPSGSGGKFVGEIAKHYNAVAGVNGGAFVDVSGRGNGGTPDGVVISEGKIRWNKVVDTKLCVTLIGLTNDNKLIVSNNLNAQKAIDKGVRDAVTFGPALIINGDPASIKGLSSGTNPRTCIGQRADGAILLLMINGRRADSIGATYADLIDIMMSYGAVNAANLDGGASSAIYNDGEYLNPDPSAVGSRGVPTAFLVR